MALPTHAVTTDSELEDAVRDITSYDATTDELPGTNSSGQMEGIIDAAKRELQIRTGSDKWYSDLAYGNALVAMTAMKAKEAVENVHISSYGIADETLSFRNADPDSSQQIQSWSRQVNQGLNKSSVSFPNQQDFGLRNTTSYIG
jgi:hypothetical protein